MVIGERRRESGGSERMFRQPEDDSVQCPLMKAPRGRATRPVIICGKWGLARMQHAVYDYPPLLV